MLKFEDMTFHFNKIEESPRRKKIPKRIYNTNTTRKTAFKLNSRKVVTLNVTLTDNTQEPKRRSKICADFDPVCNNGTKLSTTS